MTDMTDAQRKEWVIGMVARLIEAWELGSKKALAAHLGLNEKAPSNWIQKRIIPHDAIFNCHLSTGKTLHWLYFGRNQPIELTDDMNNQLEQTTDALLSSGETMEMLKVLDKGARNFIVKGMVKNLLEIVNNDQAPEET